jgi:hypothetical protein
MTLIGEFKFEAASERRGFDGKKKR